MGVTPAGSALLEQQLYLPRSWANAGKRRATTAVSEKRQAGIALPSFSLTRSAVE